MPSSRGSPQPTDQTQVSCIVGRFFTIWATREVVLNSNSCLSVKTLISTSILNEFLAGWSNLGCRFFPFSTLNISCHSFWPAEFLLKDQLLIVWGFPCILLAAFPMLKKQFKNYFKNSDYDVACCCSVIQLCLTLCNPMDCSMPGFPVLHYLPEFAQTHVHWVSNTIQPSHPLLPLFLRFSLIGWVSPGLPWWLSQ